MTVNPVRDQVIGLPNGTAFMLGGRRWERTSPAVVVEFDDSRESIAGTYDLTDERLFSAQDIETFAVIPSVDHEVSQTETRTFDRYDPSMLPMFAALAKVATDAGHCGEYDRMVATVGAPSRDEIRRLMPARRWRVSVPVLTHIEVEVEADSEQAAIEESNDASYSTEFLRQRGGLVADRWGYHTHPARTFPATITATEITGAS